AGTAGPVWSGGRSRPFSSVARAGVAAGPAAAMHAYDLAAHIELSHCRNSSLPLSRSRDQWPVAGGRGCGAWFWAQLAARYRRHGARPARRLCRTVVCLGGRRYRGFFRGQHEAYTMNRRNLARLKLLGVFMVFLGPLGLSYFLYYGLDGMGLSASANHGQL